MGRVDYITSMASLALIEDDDDEGAAAPDQSKHEEFCRDLDTAYAPQVMQRAQSLQCRRFASIPGAMWEGAGWDDFSANMIRVEVNNVAAGLEKISNDYRNNHVIVEYRAIDDGGGNPADDETAETLNGLFRADLYRSGGQQSVDNCFDEGASGGLGAFRFCNVLEDEYDPDNDNQVINVELIVDADQSVFWDPNSKRYDKSDAKWCCLVTAVARAAFEAEWGEGRAASFPYIGWKPYYDWFQPDVVRIAEWYQIEEKSQARLTLTNKITDEEKRIWAEDVSPEWIKDQKAEGWKVKSRDVPRKRVHKYTMSGAEILKDNGLIAGPNIPVVCFYGKRWFIDNQERFRGHTQLAMDSNRIYNTIVSNLVETMGRTPGGRPVFYPEEIAGHERDWARAEKDRLAFLRKNPIYTESDGTLIPRQLEYTQEAQVSAVAATLLQITASDTASLTNAEDGADEAKPNVSHEAMDLAATRTDEKTSGYMDNFRQTMEWAGKVYLGIAQETYVEEGRKVPTRSHEGEQQSATLHQPAMIKGQYLTINDFASGKFNVVADVTESSATQRDKRVRRALGLAQIAGPDTPIGQAALITVATNLDSDGQDGVQKVARQQGLSLGMFEPTDEEKQEEAQAQQNKAPDPSSQALQAQAQSFMASAQLSQARAQTERAKQTQTLADAQLKDAQAKTLDKAPIAPTGLSNPPVDPIVQAVDTKDKLASADLKTAQANKLTREQNRADSDHVVQRIKTGHQIDMERRQQELAERTQAHVESQPAPQGLPNG